MSIRLKFFTQLKKKFEAAFPESKVVNEQEVKLKDYGGREFAMELAGDKTLVRGSCTFSHYYGNFDQDNTTGLNNDMNTFIGVLLVSRNAVGAIRAGL